MKYVIMCGGDYKIPKHLLKVKGERIIDRTIRLLRENGVKDLYLSTNNPAFEELGIPILHHTNRFSDKKSGNWLDAFYPSNEPITYIYGDVYFSEYAIKTIVETNTRGILFFSSKNVNRPEYFKRWQEPFAFKVIDQQRFRNSIKICNELYKKGKTNREPISWELYRVINKYDINTHIIDKGHIAIDDYTTDVDNENDLIELERVLSNYQ